MSAVSAARPVETRRAAPASALMLVSAVADANRRCQARDQRAPTPEYLVLERDHGVELMDWSRLPSSSHRRTAVHSLRHLGHVGLKRLRMAGAILSDGEHLGIPIGLAKLAFRLDTPHVVIGHHLTTPVKRPFLRRLAAQRAISRLVVHSRSQFDGARAAGFAPSQLVVVPYGIDTAFWAPVPVDEEALILSPGREHRDHRTLAAACRTIDARVFLTGGSAHSPASRWSTPADWPRTFERGFVDYLGLRRLYAAASLVVIPLVPADFPAGVTTLLEAMAMGKATIISATDGVRDYVRDGETAVLVPPGRPEALREAIVHLLANPMERVKLGRRARRVATTDHGVELYAARLAELLREAREVRD